MKWLLSIAALDLIVLVLGTRLGYLDFTRFGIGHYRLVFDLAQWVGLTPLPEPEGPFKSRSDAENLSKGTKCSVLLTKFSWTQQ